MCTREALVSQGKAAVELSCSVEYNKAEVLFRDTIYARKGLEDRDIGRLNLSVKGISGASAVSKPTN